jgi:cell division protein FtsB
LRSGAAWSTIRSTASTRRFGLHNLMARQSPTPKQLLTLRQALIIVGIVILSYFALKYVQNVLHYRELQQELIKMEGYISAAQSEKEMLNRDFDESVSPAVVEEFARKEMNWVRKNDEVVIVVGDKQPAVPMKERRVLGHTFSTPDDNDRPNWELWLELFIDNQ